MRKLVLCELNIQWQVVQEDHQGPLRHENCTACQASPRWPSCLLTIAACQQFHHSLHTALMIFC